MKQFLVLLLSFLLIVYADAQKKYPDTFESLKNGSKLVYTYTDSLDRILLKHGKNVEELYSCSHDGLFIRLELDGGNYFMISWGGHGSGNPFFLDVYKENSGVKHLSTEGFILYEDTIKGLIIFDDKNKNTGYFTLYNLITNTYKLFKEPNDNPCEPNGCWEVTALTTTKLKIAYKDETEKPRNVEFDLMHK